MKKISDIISATPLFKGLPEGHLQEIEQIAVNKYFNKDESIFFDGEKASGFFVVVEGRIKIYKVSPEGKEQILHIFGSGEPFGEVPVFSGQQFPANAQAIEKSRLLFFPRTLFVDLISRNPALALNMLAVLSMRLRRFTVQIENLSLKEMGRELWRLVFINNGVKLTVEGSKVLPVLQELEEGGIHILVCGTCLTHFNILDKKQVGETTNMLDIVTAMQLADTVINI